MKVIRVSVLKIWDTLLYVRVRRAAKPFHPHMLTEMLFVSPKRNGP